MKNKWVVKDNFKRWWQVKVEHLTLVLEDPTCVQSLQLWTQFFDDMLNPKTEEKPFLPSLLKWRARLLALFDEVAFPFPSLVHIDSLQNEELRTGLTRARETIDMKYMEKWRRCSL